MTSRLAPTWKLALKPRRRRRRYLAGRRVTRSRDRSVTAGHRGHRRGRARHARRRDRFSRRGAREGRCDLAGGRGVKKQKNSDSARAHHSSFGCGIEMFSSAQTRCGLTDWLTTIFPSANGNGAAHTWHAQKAPKSRDVARALLHILYRSAFLNTNTVLTFARCNMKLYLRVALKPNASPSPTPLSPYRFGGSAQCLPRVHGGTFMNSSKSYTCTSQQLHPFFRS